MEREVPGTEAEEAQNSAKSDAGTQEGFSSDLPLRERRERMRRYQALGQEHLWGTATRGWSLSTKMGFWADVVTRVAGALDAAPVGHAWYDPDPDRLMVLTKVLAARSFEEAFLDEMFGWLRGAADEDPTGVLRERLLGRRWQHWARFFADAPDPSEGNATRLRPIAGRLLPPEALPVLLLACLGKGEARGYRDAALFASIYATGAGQRELTSLDLSDWFRDPPTLRLGRDQGPFQDRTLPLGSEVTNLLEGWVALRGRRPGPFFLSVDRFGAPARDGRVNAATVVAALRRRCKEAGFLPPIASEDLRRTGLTRLYEAGADPYAVADTAGFASLREARGYEPTPFVARRPPKTSGRTAFHAW